MATDAERKAKLNRASKLLNSGNKREAKKLVDEVLQDFPQDAEAWFLASLATDTLEQKLRALELALQLDPQHPKAKEYMAHLKREMPTSVSQNLSSQDIGQVIGKVIGEVTKLIGGWLGLASSPEQSAFSEHTSSTLKEKKSDEAESTNSSVSSLSIVQSSIMHQKSKGKMIEFQGVGKIVTNTIELQSGVYKVNYRFPYDDAATVVYIVNVATGSKTWFVIDRGHGSKTEHISQKGRYVFEIKLDNNGKNPDTFEWSFDIELLV